MPKSNQDKVPKDRRVKETRLEVDEWFLDVSVIDDDEPDPPSGGRGPPPNVTKDEEFLVRHVQQHNRTSIS